MQKEAQYINSFSNHLFWDVDKEKLNIAQNKSFIIQRVLEYGVMKDWQIIKKEIGVKEIASIAVTLQNLDPKALSFISLLSKIPKEEFTCYTIKQSSPRHWNF
jgi:uncharacterized protein DUF6922